MTPDQVKALFDANSVIIMFVVGLIWKYVPGLAKWPNQLIPWVNVVGYILLKVAVPEAHAGILNGVPDALGCLIGGFTSAVWARQLYEAFGRHAVEGWLKIKKPVVPAA